MGVSFRNNTWFDPFVVLFLISSSTRLSLAVTKSEINTICTGTKNPSFCFQLFKSDPHMTKLDLFGVAKFLIKYAHHEALDTQKILQLHAESIIDPFIKKGYSLCSQHFEDTLEPFDSALKSLAAKDPHSLNLDISAAIDSAETCKDDFEDVHIKLDRQILMKINAFQYLCSVPLMISTLLPNNS
ncbi:hypothetical protein N665_0003s0051 [Sinapis alba]|nr:hypothetical protein N665_0003s0051 [Sinapis alba]